MQPKAIILDLDGTVINSAKRFSKRTIEALRNVKASGIPLLFATARPPRVTCFEEIDLSLLGTMIYYNGALFDNGETIHFSIPNLKSKEIIDYCLSLEPTANLSVEVQDRWYSHKLLDYQEMMKVEVNPTIIPFDQFVSYDATKILVTDFPYSDELVSKFEDDVNILVTDSGRLVQIMSKNASKERAVEQILTSLNMNLSDAMCFGDDFNDFGLFQACGYSVAMGNAVEELKAIASEVTETNDHDGVAIVLERVFYKEKAL